MATQEIADFKLINIRYWRELSIVALMVMELSWIVPWYRALTPQTYAVSPLRVFLVLWMILLVAHLSTRAMNYLDLKITFRRWVTLALLLISTVIGLRFLLIQSQSLPVSELLNRSFENISDVRELIPNEFLVILIVILVYWRGLSLATKYIDPTTVKRNFFLGIGMFAAFIFINTLVTGEEPGILLYVFFVSGLIALGSARIYSITHLRGGIKNPFDLRWFLGILVTTVIIVGLSGFIAWFFSGRNSIIGGLGSIILSIFALIMIALISPLIFLIERLTIGSDNLSGAVQSIFDTLQDLRNTFSGIARNLYDVVSIPALTNIMEILKPFLLWSFIIMIGLGVLFSISRWLFNDRVSRQDDLESILERGDLIQLLRQAFQDRLQRIADSFQGRSRMLQGQRWLAAAKIRRIYARLMELTSKLGKSRPPAHTPLEYLSVLEELFPNGKDEVNTITRAYLRIRYGELPETVEEVREVESAWEHIRAMGKDRIATMSKKKGSNI
jgi:hypothetical protein